MAGAVVEPEEHSYSVVEGEVEGFQVVLTEYMESKLEELN